MPILAAAVTLHDDGPPVALGHPSRWRDPQGGEWWVWSDWRLTVDQVAAIAGTEVPDEIPDDVDPYAVITEGVEGITAALGMPEGWEPVGEDE